MVIDVCCLGCRMDDDHGSGDDCDEEGKEEDVLSIWSNDSRRMEGGDSIESETPTTSVTKRR